MFRVPSTTIWVHALIADRTAAMVLAAAMDGVVLDGWAFRSTARQVELRRAHCGGSFDSVFNAPSSSCAPPTARPGRSMHERGLAIDFKNCSSRGTACYQWLAGNAARFGLFNLPSEPWHWSVNGN
jgi:LAS superfamily LD-carboxypeptidase LdcB